MQNNICFNDITFNGRNFHTMSINVPGWGVQAVASIALARHIMQDGKYASDEARTIDKSIFYFVDSDKFSSLPDKELGQLLAKEVG